MLRDSMPDLTNYPANLLPLPPRISEFIELIEREGFHVHTTNDSRAPDGARYTLVIDWAGEYVGYMKHDIWIDDGPIVGYHFGPGRRNGGNACPADFDKGEFARMHGISPDSLYVFPNGGREYLRVWHAEAALRLLRASAAEIDALKPDSEPEEESEQDKLQQDIDEVRNRKDIPATSKKRLVDARLGQGRYRKDLEHVFGGRCAVTGLQLRQALRASHVLAWSRSTDKQRLDPDNGLLLTANLDALFDRHLVTFDVNGRLRVSHRVKQTDRQLLIDLADLRRAPTEQQWVYLKQHNDAFDTAERFAQ